MPIVDPIRYRSLSALTPDLPTIDDLKDDLQAALDRYFGDSLSDRSESNPVVVMMDLVCAYSAKWILDKVVEIMQQGFIESASGYEFAAARAKDYGYHPSPGNASRGTVTITRAAPATYGRIVNRDETAFYTERQGETEPIRFELVEESVTVPASAGFNASVSAEVIQGTLIENELLGVADGTPLQEFETDQGIAVPNLETVTIFDPTGPVSGEVWTRTTNLLLHTGTDKIYEVTWGEDGKMRILFGTGNRGRDDDHGAAPSGDVKITYRVIPEDEDGDVAEGSIIVISPSAPDLTVTNGSATSGYAPPDDVADLRFAAPRSARVNVACCAEDDTPAIVEREFSSVGRFYIVPGYRGEDTVGGFILSSSGGYVSSEIAQEVRAFIEAHNPATQWDFVRRGQFTTVTVYGTVYGKRGYTSSELMTAINTALTNEFGPLAKDTAGNYKTTPGQIVYPGQIQGVISSIAGVDYFDMTSPTAPTACSSTALPQIVPEITIVENDD